MQPEDHTGKQHANPKGKFIYKYEVYLDRELNNLPRFDMTSGEVEPTPKCYRFVKCAPLLGDKTIMIELYEYEKLPSSYTAISHIWYGNEGSKGGGTIGTFEVKDKSTNNASGPPISTQILRMACLAAQNVDTNLIWLDRLCINKSDKADSDWQITEMHKIYEHSKLCVVFPNGLGKLTSLSQETSWINRGWTLQEAVAPSNVQVMFKWDLGESMAQADLFDKAPSKITKITDDCAMAPLPLLLDCSISGVLKLVKDSEKNSYVVSMFGTSRKPEANPSIDYRYVLPNVSALAIVLKMRPGQPEQCKPVYHHCLWKSTMMRTTSVPADMIFSVMGLFGQVLDPKDYDPRDYIKPAIALARLISTGSGATWLGISPLSPPCPRLSTFPSFPQTVTINEKEFLGVEIPGKGYTPVSNMMLNEYPIIVGGSSIWLEVLKDEIDPDGYLHFKGTAIPVSRSTDLDQAGSSNNDTEPIKRLSVIDYAKPSEVAWYTPLPRENGKQPESDTYAVLLGSFREYSPFKDPQPNDPHAPSRVRGFIVVRQEDENEGRKKFNLKSYCMLHKESEAWLNNPQWERREFRVGGPQKISPAILLENYSRETLGSFESSVASASGKTLNKDPKKDILVSGTNPASAKTSIKFTELAEREVLASESHHKSNVRGGGGSWQPSDKRGAVGVDRASEKLRDITLGSEGTEPVTTARGKIRIPDLFQLPDKKRPGASRAIFQANDASLATPLKLYNVQGGDLWRNEGLWKHEKVAELQALVAQKSKK
ncbi:unnamed protein product [Rhizoctonia solani]|uniref:Heterokaryon incompatibility domain-containing protein n=1 Tax=Rhizoctonia solani TaxID=456999 RepID=A0A8H3DSA1_9AGAM|nr:unnamed protein product [Rhizoctonia solani]